MALWIGLFLFILSLGIFAGTDILGWGVTTSVWTDASKALAPIAKDFQGIKGDITKIDGQKLTLKKADGKEETVTVKEDTSQLKVGEKYEKKGLTGFMSLLYTYLFLLVVMTIAATALKANIGKFIFGFTVVFWVSYICWIIGSWANIAVTTPPDMKKFGISWSLKLTAEAGFIVALIAGLIVGNFFQGIGKAIKEAVRPELYIKTAIVILGGFLGVVAAEKLGLATAVMFRGLCAIVEAYLIYWALVYLVARKYFKFSKEWAAPLASGISICGVSAAIATGGAIRARPIVPIMVSSLVVIFAVVELLVLPFLAENFLWKEPMVAGAWMGLAVKTDGAAVASGAVTESLVRAKALAMEGVNYKEGWIVGAAATVKVFIDVFIGVWAFVLAIIWCSVIECKPGERVRVVEIWHRFPKFVIGYVITFFVILYIGIKFPGLMGKTKAAMGEGNVFRGIFFTMTFFTIGVVSNFKKLWEEGIGKLAAVYLLCLFGFIIWIGLFISWLFFHGVKPPVITG
ncbi:MAG: putative sulfate exporter family transporter [Nitrospirae bacterium]|nr:putative sulfate exporter family transporter [Nitrospirota bacterium]